MYFYKYPSKHNLFKIGGLQSTRAADARPSVSCTCTQHSSHINLYSVLVVKGLNSKKLVTYKLTKRMKLKEFNICMKPFFYLKNVLLSRWVHHVPFWILKLFFHNIQIWFQSMNGQMNELFKNCHLTCINELVFNKNTIIIKIWWQFKMKWL